ncbi:hypothetical protein BJ742DRAFT_437843 [Cladochytrium replicatum]|nr:hypothetical protein BJ742DRAFT_437843 [Cladochytrium replicatum]
MEPFAEPHVIDCGHSYCYTCLSLWLKKSRSCPSCRAVVKALPVRNRALLECVEAHISRMEPAAAETARSRVRREQENFRNLVSPWSEIMPFGLADPIDDEADQVLRCPMCTWEVVDGLCVNCGAAYGGNMSSGEDVEVLSDYSDSDISGHSRIYLDDEAEEVEDSEDEEHYIRQFRQDFGSPAFSGSNHSISSDGSYSPGRFAAESPDYIPRSDAWFPRGSNNRSQSPDYYSAPATPEHASNSDEDMYSPERSPQNYLIFNNDEIILRSRRMQPVQYRELSEGEEEGEDVDDDDIIVRPVRRPPIFSDDESGEGHDVDEPIEEDEADGEDDLTVGRGVSRIPKRVIISDDSSEEESENGQLNGTDANERAGVGSDDDGKEDDNSDDEIIRRLPKRKSPWMVTETGDMEFESSSSNGREGMARAVAVPSRSGAGRPPRWAQQGLRAAVPELSSGQERRQDGMSNRRGCLANTHGENADSYTSSGPLESPSRYEEDTDGEQTDSSIRLPISNRPTRRSSNEDQSCDGLDDEDGVGESVEEPSDDEDNRSPSNAQFILDLRRPRTWHQAADTSNGNEQVGKYWNKPRFSALPLRLELDMSAAASSNHKTKHSCETSDEPLIAHGMLEFERQWRETLRQHTEATKEVRRLIEGSRCSCDVFDPWLRRSEHVNVRVGVGSECSSDDEENCITVTSVRPRRLPPLREKPA